MLIFALADAKSPSLAPPAASAQAHRGIPSAQCWPASGTQRSARIRVSSKDQNEARQVIALNEAGVTSENTFLALIESMR